MGSLITLHKYEKEERITRQKVVLLIRLSRTPSDLCNKYILKNYVCYYINPLTWLNCFAFIVLHLTLYDILSLLEFLTSKSVLMLCKTLVPPPQTNAMIRTIMIKIWDP